MNNKINMPKHLHTYKRKNLVPSWKTKLPESHKHYRPSHIVFKCTKATCNHWILVADALGKLAECNRCHNPFIIDKETIKLAVPHCQDCIVRKEKPDVEAIIDLLKDTL